MSIDVDKKSNRGRPPVDSELVSARMQRPLLDALDLWCGEQADKPGRPEGVRRLIRAALDQELSNSRAPVAIEEVQARGAAARSRAATTADEEMLGFHATGDEKGDRRRALTEEPSIVADAKAQAVRRSRK